MQAVPDYSGIEDAPIEDNILSRIGAKCRELLAADIEVQRLENELKKHKAIATNLSEKVLPSLLEEGGGSTSFDHADFKMKQETKMFGSCPSPTTKSPELRNRAIDLMAWLDDNGHGSIIKREMRIRFEGNEQQIGIVQSLSCLADVGGLSPVDYSVIAPQTFLKFVRDCKEEGIDLPEKLFVVEERKVCKVTAK